MQSTKILLTLLFVLAACPASAAPQSVFPDPGLRNPRLRFHLGQSAGNRPAISPIVPDMPGPVSQWYVTQWNQSSYMGARNLDVGKPDPRLGKPLYGFAAPDHHSHVWIYRDAAGNPVYDLYEQGGTLKAGGGTNLFLSADALPGTNFGHEIDYTVDLKMSHAVARYFTPTAQKSGAVLAQVFTGFSVYFINPESGARQSVFLQIPVMSSRETVFPGMRMCTGQVPSLYSARLSDPQLLMPFSPQTGPPRKLHYVLNDYMEQMVSAPFHCAGQDVPWPAAARDLANWHIGSIFIGLETEAANLKADADTQAVQGEIETGIQVSNLQVMDLGWPYKASNLSQAAPHAPSASGSFCNSSHQKIAWRCGPGSGGEGWVDVGSGCFHHGTGQSCAN